MVSVTDVINRQYPHWLYVRFASQAEQNEQTGQWEAQPGAWQRLCQCREETNGRGSQIQAAGGEFVTFGAVVHIPAKGILLPLGTEVAVSDFSLYMGNFDTPGYVEQSVASGQFRIHGFCLKFDKGRLHSRLWV